MALADDLGQAAMRAAAYAEDGERVVGVLATEPTAGARVYLCALGGDDGPGGWIALDEAGASLTRRDLLRDAVAVAALCEIAVDAAFPGDLDELRAQLVQVRITEAPPGIEDAEAAAAALQHVLGAPPQLATPARLDAIGDAARRLELALAGAVDGSLFTVAMRSAQGAVDDLWQSVAAGYRGTLA